MPPWYGGRWVHPGICLPGGGGMFVGVPSRVYLHDGTESRVTGPLCTPAGCPFYTFITVVEDQRRNHAGKTPLSLQEITSSWAETALFGQRNPLQRVGSHKGDGNTSTPPKVVSGPPQGHSPPFNSGKRRRRVPWFKAELGINVQKVIKSGPRCIRSFRKVKKKRNLQNRPF